MADRTSSSSAPPSRRNGRAWAALVCGLLAVAALPAAIGLAQLLETVELLDAAAAIPVAAAFGIAAVVLARGARRRIERTIGRVGGRVPARLARVLGVFGLCLAAAGAIAVASYYALSQWAD
ncbi:MAG TPA: hypothetical protein VGQ15_00950 [Gaiellaceae bacterium]|nr:hypothetical protein [Gaiellaceae bacterium]